jgi:hypothetical protein
MAKRKRVHIDVTESASAHGHAITRYDGPVRWAVVYEAPTKIIVRRGTVATGDIPPEATIIEKSDRDRAHGSARRYARKRT